MYGLRKIVERIVLLNHAWKVARNELGADHAITMALRLQKSSWQATLLRSFPLDSYLKKDNENTEGEPLLSVRLSKPLSISGSVRHDAEHIPERIAKNLFLDKELIKLTR